VTDLSTLCLEMELKNIEIKKQKNRIFCCEGHLASGCAVMSKYFLEITLGGL